MPGFRIEPLQVVEQFLVRKPCRAGGQDFPGGEEELQRNDTVEGAKLLPRRLLKPGEQVRVTAGPFAQFVAEIETIAPGRRVWVLMEIMGGQTRVAVKPDQLRLVGA